VTEVHVDCPACHNAVVEKQAMPPKKGARVSMLIPVRCPRCQRELRGVLVSVQHVVRK
jgi:endogenous inhibitor of DNA gyrase (YacG/DUF329 family)